MIEIIGWVSAFLFAGCGVPQAVQSYKNGNSIGISALFLWMWFFGEILAIVYVLGKHGVDGPLLFNYVLNIFFISIILKYRIKPRA